MGLLVFAGFVMGFNSLLNDELNGPDENYCFLREDQHETAIWIDNSLNTQQSASQLRDYATTLGQAYENSPPNGRIMMFSTASDISGSLPVPIFEICRYPSSLSEMLAIGAAKKTAPYLERRAEEVEKIYNEEVEQILTDLQNSDKRAVDSPLLEQVRGISRYKGFQGSSRSFYLLTDGLNNTRLARFGTTKGDMPSFSVFSQRPDYEMNIKPRSLEG
ncbi:MAG: hypothetical protein JKY84_02440, partial [Emcibacteraceae bacterium]|nr:hypothetical protein [Emcibacteraceae bacterium]